MWKFINKTTKRERKNKGISYGYITLKLKKYVLGQQSNTNNNVLQQCNTIFLAMTTEQLLFILEF